MNDEAVPSAQRMEQADALADIEVMVAQRVSRMALVGEVIQIASDGAPSARRAVGPA